MQKEKMLSKKKISKLFKTFDLDGDGYISKSEWQSIMGGLEMSDNEWGEFLRECDGNSDGKVNFV